MRKPQRGVDGHPCPKKQRSEEGKRKVEGHNLLIEKVFKGNFAPPSGKVPGIRGGPLGSKAIRNFYDLSETPKITPIKKDQLFSLTQLAMWTYNFKEDTKFDNVNVLRGNHYVSHDIGYYITFQAFSPQGVATTFQTKICKYFPKPCSKIEIIFVRIIPDDSDFDDFTVNSKKCRPYIAHPKDRDYRKRLYQLIEKDPQFKLPVYLSQFALINYNNIKLHLNAARHDISSLTIVKPMEHVRKQTTYLLTFEAALCDDSKEVETFETEIYIPTLFPTTIIEFWDFEIKTN